MRKKTALTAALIAAIPITMAALDREEGLSLKAYPDTGAVWTICRGETRGVQEGDVATRAECDRMTLSGAIYYKDVVHAALPYTPSAAQSAGLTIFTYNVGTGAFLRSTLLRKLRAGDPKACDEILRWTRVGGRDCRFEKGRKNGCYGIVQRRERERLACTGTLPREWQNVVRWDWTKSELTPGETWRN